VNDTVDNAAFIEPRDELVHTIERDQEELRHAVRELTEVATTQLEISERIRQNPVPWLLGGFLCGLWLGNR
jgi:hypothetical protein